MGTGPTLVNKRILILNSGSSSLKYSVFRVNPITGLDRLDHGLIEGVGGAGPKHHAEALERVMALLDDEDKLTAVGHRVVHGGDHFGAATRIDDPVVEAIRTLVPLAPLHNPANLEGILACLRIWPDVPQIAVFDTAFHQSMPESAYRYPLPDAFFENHHIRRYGFHGTSYQSIVRRMARHLDKRTEQINLIAFHLGNGASVCRIEAGQSRDTSMGMTPLGGLMMGGRSGDLDPGVVLHLLKGVGLSTDRLDALLNRESGLRGVAGTNDMRDILAGCQRGDPHCQLAFDLYIKSARHFLGAYLIEMREVDAICFSGGVGENAPEVRAQILMDLEWAGVSIDPTLNMQCKGRFSEVQNPTSRIRVMIAPQEEEREIAEQTLEVLAVPGGRA